MDEKLRPHQKTGFSFFFIGFIQYFSYIVAVSLLVEETVMDITTCNMLNQDMNVGIFLLYIFLIA